MLAVYRMTGEFDYLVRARVADMPHYDRFYQGLIARVPMADVSASFVMEEIKETTELPLAIPSARPVCTRPRNPLGRSRRPREKRTFAMLKIYLMLIVAVMAETAATSALQASQQFTRLGPSIVVVIGYALAFYFLALTLKVLPVGIAYAMWSGLGIVFIALIGYLVFGQKLDTPAILGTVMILGGIVVIQLFSKATPH